MSARSIDSGTDARRDLGTDTGPERAPAEIRDPAVAQAEADVEATRERVGESMLALRREVARRTDWRAWIGRRPRLVLAASFGLGLLVGYFGRARRPGNAIGGRSWR